MTYNAKPEPRTKTKRTLHRSPLRRLGARQGRYWSWLQAVVYPALWFGGFQNEHGKFWCSSFTTRCGTAAAFRITGSIRITMRGEPVGQLSLLEKPNEHGRWWLAEGFVVDHVLPRAHRPDLVYSLENIQLLTPEENRIKGGSHE